MSLRLTFLTSVAIGAYLATTGCQRTQDLKPVQRDVTTKNTADDKKLTDTSTKTDPFLPESKDESDKEDSKVVITPTKPVKPGPTVTPVKPVLPNGTQWDGLSDYSSDPKIKIKTITP